MALVLAGAAGIAGHSGHRGHRRGFAALTVPEGTAVAGGGSPTGPTSTTVPGPLPADSASLGAGLIDPTDMGGYYRVAPSVGASLLASAPCLAPRQATAPIGRAATALLGPDRYSMPTIVEEVSSYPAPASGRAYRSAVAAMDGCPSLSFDFLGTSVTARVAPARIPSVGDADAVWGGSFAYGSSSFTVQVGLVLDGPDVLAVIWMDTVPPLNPVMGDFPSTVSLAIGKLA